MSIPGRTLQEMAVFGPVVDYAIDFLVEYNFISCWLHSTGET